MTTGRLAEIRKEAYNEAYGFDGSYGMPAGYDKFLDLYEMKKAIQEFNEQPLTFYPHEKNVKKAKEIALDAAVQLSGRLPTQVTFGEGKIEPSPVVTLAKEIYEWLTEPETDKR
jgi:hypothetical protein